MAEQNSPQAFFHADEDVFIGKKRTQREIIKSTVLGQNYESPIGKGVSSSTSNLPDVISSSSETNSPECGREGDSHFPLASGHVQSDDDDVVIINDSVNDSVQVISDDDETEADSTNGKSAEASVKKEHESVIKSYEVLAEVPEPDKRKLSEENIENLKTYNWNTLLDVIPVEETESKELETGGSQSSDNLSIHALIAASKAIEAQSSDDTQKNAAGKSSLNPDEFSNVDFSLLAGVSDSILNISHGSSLPSPATEPNNSSLGLLATAVYEDISCDGDQLEVDLHMTVDETDFLRQNTKAGSDTTRSTFYNSCINEGSVSTYMTANNTENTSLLKQTSSSFSDYREQLDDSFVEGDREMNSMELDLVKENEKSFEAITNNRQNSFTPSFDETEKSDNSTHKTKPFVSKLPVLNSHSNILKPSLLNVADSKLKVRSFKWAKTLSKPYQTENKGIPKHQPSTNKIPGPEKKSPSKDLLSKSKITLSGSKVKTIAKTLVDAKTPAKIVLANPTTKVASEKKGQIPTVASQTLLKTLLNNKTPAKSTCSQPSKLDKADLTPRARTPASVALSSSKRSGQKNLLVDQERYKNVISPVRTYINSQPVTTQRQNRVPEEPCELLFDRKATAGSHIPVPWNTPTPGSNSKKVSSSIPVKNTKVAQKLHYNNQENLDPNYTRDTLPPRVFEPAVAVFMKEPEIPKKHLPKMGGSMQKLLDTPRPKVIHHQGRVKESPKIKGKLLPIIKVLPSTPEDQASSAAADISIRLVKTEQIN